MGHRGAATLALLFLVVNMWFDGSIFGYGEAARCPPPPSHGIGPGSSGRCPKDTLKFGVCGSWLGLVREEVGTKPAAECCTLVEGLADLEAAACLCTAINARVLGAVNLHVPIAVSLLLNGCGKKIPDGFVCK